MRAVYSAGESCDSNPIIASLDPHSSSRVRQDTAQKSTDENTHVHAEQSNGAGGENVVMPCFTKTETHTAAAAKKDGPMLLFPPPPPPHPHHEKDNSGQPQEEGELHSLSSSTMSDHVVSEGGDGEMDARSPSSTNKNLGGEKESCSASPQPTPTSHTEIEKDCLYKDSGAEPGAGDGGERRNTENGAQLPADFDSTHLFQLVPKGHHITDETVSVMSNATEEYVGESSSRDTLSRDRSLTSMIFGARDSGDSMSAESELSDNEPGDRHAKKLEQSIEQIQKSYLSRLPQQNSHATTYQEEEEEEREDKRDAEKTKDGVQSHCCSIPVHDSHVGMINTDIPSAVPTPDSINITPESDPALEAISHPASSVSPPPLPPSSLPTFGIPTMPHPSPFLFDGISSAVSSKRIPPSLHPLSNVQLQGELQGLALAQTTSLISDPDILTTGLGSPSLQADTYTDACDPTTTTNTFPVRNKALGCPKEILPEKFSEVAIADDACASHSQSCDTIRENNELSFPLSEPWLSNRQPVQEWNKEPSITETPLGTQTAKPEAFHHVAMCTQQQSSQLLLGSALEAAPSETIGSAAPNNHGIPTRDTGDFERDENLKRKPSSVDIEPNTSPDTTECAREDCCGEGEKNEGMNKFDLETVTMSADLKVQLPSQLEESFDPLQHSQKLPNVQPTDANLISGLTQKANKTSIDQSTASTTNTHTAAAEASSENAMMGGKTCKATSQVLVNDPQIVSASQEQASSPAAAVVHAVKETEEATCKHKTKGTPPNNSTSSALLASLLLSQLESDLNTPS